MRKITRALGMIHPIPDKLYLKLAYRLEFGEKLDLEEPATFNQKLQWIKLNGATFRFSHLADKSQAREHVEKVLGPEYLIPLLGLYDDPKQIPWHALPAQFAVKCTHGSHCGLLRTGQGSFSVQAAQRKLVRWMKRCWYWFGREPVYLGIRPRVIVEKYLGQGDRPPDDYKVMCFNGVPKVVQLHQKIAKGHAITFYGVDGQRLELSKVATLPAGPTGWSKGCWTSCCPPPASWPSRWTRPICAPIFSTCRIGWYSANSHSSIPPASKPLLRKGPTCGWATCCAWIP